MTRKRFLPMLLIGVCVVVATPCLAEDSAPTLVVPEGAQAGPDFDVERATEAWVDTLSPEQRARSDAYFEGGYVLQMVDFVYGIGVAALFLLTPLSSRMRTLAERLAKGATPRSFIYAVQYVVLLTVFTFPSARGSETRRRVSRLRSSWGACSWRCSI
jgi:STE24 endopeptidase